MNTMSAPVERFGHAFTIFQCGLPTDFRIGPCAQTLGHRTTELQHAAAAERLERLRIGIGHDEFHAFQRGLQHVRDRIATTTTYTYHLDHRIRQITFHHLKHGSPR